MDSLWSKTAQKTAFPTMKKDEKTEILIIGGGITGVLCAYLLEKAGVDYRLVEAKEIGSGITKDTTAKITCQHGLIYQKIADTYGLEQAGQYLSANRAALEQYHRLCGDVDCEFQFQDSFVYATENREKLEREANIIRRLGCPASLVTDVPLPVSTVGAVSIPGQAQFHPLKFLYGLAAGLRIWEHTKVQQFVPDGVLTDCGKITAKKVIVATHFPMLNKHGGYFLKLYQHRSYVLALEGASLPEGMYVDEADSGLSFRRYGGLLLLGGGGHRTGKSGGGWREQERLAARWYPRSREVARWATQDCMSLDGMPYIGRYCHHTPNLYVATGYNKWGMTSAMVAATVLADMVRGRENPLAPLFDPSRRLWHPQLAINSGEAVLGLLKLTRPRCPHLGCALTYNPQEHSWDCPCHGSRFGEDGQVIDNPATDDIDLS